ncbi:hypothetical protein ACTXOR_12985 [Arthrobacter rhombi]|uniref:hypothetical protein n=1 Tax=Arthrobacter rhombi TaxID=71253 RepID=UPI003FD05865
MRNRTATDQQGTVLSRAMRPVNHLVEKFIPWALVFAIALTFMTQMAVVLLLGSILANTRPVRRLLGFLGFLGGIPPSPI